VVSERVNVKWLTVTDSVRVTESVTVNLTQLVESDKTSVRQTSVRQTSVCRLRLPTTTNWSLSDIIHSSRALSKRA